MTLIRWVSSLGLVLSYLMDWVDLIKVTYFLISLLLMNCLTYLLTYLESRDRRLKIRKEIFASFLILDALIIFTFCLTTGGMNNPFAFLFLVQMAYSAQILNIKAIWGFAIYLSGLYTVLFLYDNKFFAHHHHGLHGGEHFYHLLGMLLSFYFLCFFLAKFVGSTVAKLRDIEQREKERETLVVIGTLAAQAAHQMGTPLNSLSLLIERVVPRDGEFFALFKKELGRCKEILQQLTKRTSLDINVKIQYKTLAEMINAIRERWYAKDDVNLSLQVDHEETCIHSDNLLEYAFLNLMDNAYEAGAKDVIVRGTVTKEKVEISLSDNGMGFSTEMLKSPADHFGLGLYLASMTLKHKGGELKLQNNQGTQGALVTLVWKNESSSR